MRYFSHEWTRWNNCYVLADYLQDLSFKDVLVDVALEIVKPSGRAWATLGATVYEHSHKDSAHRKFAVEVCAVGLWENRLKMMVKEPECQEFMDDLSMYFIKCYKGKRKVRNVLKEEVRCEFHDHKDMDGKDGNVIGRSKVCCTRYDSRDLA